MVDVIETYLHGKGNSIIFHREGRTARRNRWKRFTQKFKAAAIGSWNSSTVKFPQTTLFFSAFRFLDIFSEIPSPLLERFVKKTSGFRPLGLSLESKGAEFTCKRRI